MCRRKEQDIENPNILSFFEENFHLPRKGYGQVFVAYPDQGWKERCSGMRGIFPGLCVSALVLFSGEAMQAASQAAAVFGSGVMPALFPMMVVSRLLPSGSGALVPEALFAFASGSPASAQRVRRLFDNGLSQGRAEILLLLTGVMSPMFFTGTLAAWTGEQHTACAMLLLHWLSAILCAMLWSRFVPARQASPLSLPHEEKTGLSAAIVQSAQALMAVCGAMMLFSIAAGVLRAALSRLFPAFALEKLFSLMHAVLEIGGGTAAVLNAWEEPPYALLSALCSFGGLSIWMQNLLFADKCIRPAKLLGMRALHGAVCYLLSLWLLPAVSGWLVRLF